MAKTLNFYGGERMTEYVAEMEAEMCEVLNVRSFRQRELRDWRF